MACDYFMDINTNYMSHKLTETLILCLTNCR